MPLCASWLRPFKYMDDTKTCENWHYCLVMNSKIKNKYLRSSLEGQFKVVFPIFRWQRAIVKLVRVEFMDQSAKSQTIAEATTEVSNIYSLQ